MEQEAEQYSIDSGLELRILIQNYLSFRKKYWCELQRFFL
jgi:hypothetical protein